MLAAKTLERAFIKCRVLLQFNKRERHFTAHAIVHADDCGVLHAVVTIEHFFDLARKNILAADDHHLFDASCDRQQSLVVKSSHVT